MIVEPVHMPSMIYPTPSSTQHDEKQILQEFHKHLDSFWECWQGPTELESPQAEARFLNLQKFKDYMKFPIIGSLLKGVLLAEELDDIDTVAKVVKEDYRRLFALLLKLGEGPQIRNFLSHDKFKDSNLPLTDNTQPLEFPHGKQNFWERFKKEQHHFFPFVFGNLDRQTKLGPERILPFTYAEELQPGGYSTVSRVVVSDSLNAIERERCQNPHNNRHNTYVLKQYRLSELEHYNHEKKAYSMLQRNSSGREGLIQFFGTFQHGDIYVVVLEWADQGTLNDFFRTVDPPTEPQDIQSFWKRVLKLTSGLKTISTASTVPNQGQQRFQGVHQDIKPENILVCSGTKNESEHEFKLADLGTTHFSVETHGDTVHIDYRGTREFGAPEASRDDTNREMAMGVTAKVDVWSLACVLSITATWLLHNRRGIQNYERKRQEATKDLHYRGAFHDGAQVLKVVREHHNRLKRDAKTRGDECTESVIQMIEESMYNPGERLNANQMRRWSDNAISKPAAKEYVTSEVNSAPPDDIDRTVLQNLSEQEVPKSPTVVLTPPKPLETVTLTREVPIKDCRQKSPKDAKKKIPRYSFAEGLEWRKRRETESNHVEPPHAHLRDDNLQDRDHVFMVDRTATMKPHWQDVQNVIWVLSKIVKVTDENGLDLYVMPGPNSPSNYSDSTPMKNKVRDIGALDDADRKLNINMELEKVLLTYRNRIQSSYNARSSRTRFFRRKQSISGPKPLSLYILTDGKWAPKVTGEGPIQQVISTLQECKYTAHQVGIQFIQFGSDDNAATERLKHLDSGLKSQYGYDIVDTTRSDGNIWKMLLGGLHEWFDDDDDVVDEDNMADNNVHNDAIDRSNAQAPTERTR